MFMKKIVLMAAAIVTLAACTSEDYLGNEDAARVGKGEKAISFSSSTGRVTRASGGEAATALGNSFNVYGVKKVGDTYTNVFAKDVFSAATDYNAQTYTVSWATSTAGTTASNTSNWEYVDEGNNQTIKYWDYSANQYEFVAYKATEGTPTITKYQKDGFTVEATAAELAGLYIADKVTITEKNGSPAMPATLKDNKIGDIVQFTFRAGAAKVRLGIYETIDGYVVKNVYFRPQASEFTATNAKAMLCGTFHGSSSSGSDTYTVTYDATGKATFATTTTASNYFDFGAFDSSTSLGTSSTAPTWASGSADYRAVLPNTDHVANMSLKVDYDLYCEATHETIHVTNARCVVPSIYMAWNPNYAYTYLFKISDNTNGTTGPAGSPEGLYPITFDAVTVAATDDAQVGTITTVSTPAITTYMDGSVSAAGIAYTTASANPIYVTVNTDGTLASLTSENLKLYTVPTGTTEADLVLASVTKTEVTGTGAITVPLTAAETVKGINFAATTTAKFVPAAAGTYAVEFTDGPAATPVKHYKVIIVS